MKKCKYVFIVFLSIFLTISIISMVSSYSKTEEIVSVGNEKIKESVLKSETDDSNFVQLTKINDNVWVHTTYYKYNGVKIDSNGLLVLTSKGLVLIDTGWTNDQTKELIRLTKEKFNKDIIASIITHAHMDKIGGIKTLLENKIDVKSTPLTSQIAEKLGYDKPNPSITSDDIILEFGDTKLEVYFPGEAHTIDNIVVWLPEYKILFGGCMLKSLDSKNMGNIQDSNMEKWPDSVNNLIKKFPDATIVIPTHGKWGDKKIFTHTLNLLEIHNAQR